MVGMGTTVVGDPDFYGEEADNYMIRCKEAFIPFDLWRTLYGKVKRGEIESQNFGYGIKVDSTMVPELDYIRDELPFKQYFFFLISNRRNREFPIHVDGVPGENNASSVNWPIENCTEESVTEWFRPTGEVLWDDKDRSFFMKNADEVVKVHEAPMVTSTGMPYLFRSDLLHRGYCQLENSKLRIIVKWELDYADWDTACREFRDRNYI
jgi:hypothetical protein